MVFLSQVGLASSDAPVSSKVTVSSQKKAYSDYLRFNPDLVKKSGAHRANVIDVRGDFFYDTDQLSTTFNNVFDFARDHHLKVLYIPKFGRLTGKKFIDIAIESANLKKIRDDIKLVFVGFEPSIAKTFYENTSELNNVETVQMDINDIVTALYNERETATAAERAVVVPSAYNSMLRILFNRSLSQIETKAKSLRLTLKELDEEVYDPNTNYVGSSKRPNGLLTIAYLLSNKKSVMANWPRVDINENGILFNGSKVDSEIFNRVKHLRKGSLVPFENLQAFLKIIGFDEIATDDGTRPASMDICMCSGSLPYEKRIKALNKALKNQSVDYDYEIVAAMDPDEFDTLVEQVDSGKISQHVVTTNILNTMMCPISKQLLVKPVLIVDGHTFEEFSFQSWLNVSPVNPRNPMTNKVLVSTDYVPNVTLQKCIWAILDRINHMPSEISAESFLGQDEKYALLEVATKISEGDLNDVATLNFLNEQIARLKTVAAHYKLNAEISKPIVTLLTTLEKIMDGNQKKQLSDLERLLNEYPVMKNHFFPAIDVDDDDSQSDGDQNQVSNGYQVTKSHFFR